MVIHQFCWCVNKEQDDVHVEKQEGSSNPSEVVLKNKCQKVQGITETERVYSTTKHFHLLNDVCPHNVVTPFVMWYKSN